ncbi:MAG: class E sortase [Patescibacteria group bacterium]|nr:class E sortase [Patescibacteria group bacterium]MDE1946135.1 class E sortase [Patescibacteria group bacterium]
MAENNTQSGNGILETVVRNKFHFFLDVAVIFLITLGILYLFGLVPAELQSTVGRYPGAESTGGEIGELPLSLVAPSVGINTQVYNPSTTSIPVLDSYLLKGAVRYPGSGLPGGQGNIFIFGHSTGYKTVINQAFKTFVGLENLKPGDPIYVYSNDTAYIYKVQWVKKETADQALVVFDTKDNLLTLSTCDSFGAKTDRYVAQAIYASKQPLAKTASAQ